MRIVAGTARGRAIEAPRGAGTRPTSDKVRAAVFNILGQFFAGGAVLDLYAGSGALALEALSRGYDRAVCVEDDRAAVEVIRRNASACGFADRVEIRHGQVEAVLRRLPPATFALAFVDAPYAAGPGVALALLGPALAPGAVVVAEHDARRPPEDRYPGLGVVDRRSYGGTGISIYRRD